MQLTQKKLANIADLPDARSIGRIENAEHSPTVETICKLARAFEVDPVALYQEPVTSSAITRLNFLFYFVRQLQSRGEQHGIVDIFYIPR